MQALILGYGDQNQTIAKERGEEYGQVDEYENDAPGCVVGPQAVLVFFDQTIE